MSAMSQKVLERRDHSTCSIGALPDAHEGDGYYVSDGAILRRWETLYA